MQSFKRFLTITAAAALLNCGILPALPQQPHSLPDSAQIRAFIQTLSALPVPAESFAALTFDRSEQQLYSDGVPVGTSYAGFTVRDGQLTVSAQALGLDSADTLTPAEAAAEAGLEWTEDADGCTTIRAPFQSSRLIVRCEDELPETALSESVAGFRDMHILQYDSPAEAYAAYQQFQSDSRVTQVQPDQIYHADMTISAIPDAQKDSAVSEIGADAFCNRLLAEKDTLPEIKVAVMDTGLFQEHVWFTDRIAEGGIAMITNDSDTFHDAHGHGTHCAGIIAESTPDNVSILPIKVLSDRGYGYDTGIYCGMLYAIEQGADVVSMSFGGNGESWLMNEGIAALTAAGIPCIAAAGNEHENAKYHHPASNPDCVTVSAVIPWGETGGYQRAEFSNFGGAIDFCAPGYQIISALCDESDPTATGMMSGTSMSTPFVAAAYADLLSYNPALTSAQIYECLKENAADLGTPGFDPDFGWGMINLDGIEIPAADAPAPVQTTAPDVSALLPAEPEPEAPDLNSLRTRILPDVPFAHASQEYYFVLLQDASLSLKMQSGAPAIGYIEGISDGSACEITSAMPVTLTAGTYTMNIEATESGDPLQQEIYYLHTEALSIYMAEVASADAFYTGEPVTPHVQVRLNDQLLREDIDYIVENDTALIEPGCYQLNIRGIGRYYDSCAFTFRIMQPAQADTPLLTEGSLAPVIESPGTSYLYRWIPEHPQYCFSRTDTRPGTIRILDASGNLTGALCGMEQQNVVVDVTPGAEYTVSVSLESRTLTGAFPFSLTSDFRLLSDCTVQMADRHPHAAGIPQYEIYDGDILLTEGTDYIRFGTGGEKQPGTAIAVFRGLGKYYGTVEHYYTICPDSLNPVPVGIPESVDVPQDSTVSATRETPGSMRLFRFAAPTDGTYRVMLPDYETTGVTAFVYDWQGNLAEEGQTVFSLKKQEALQILCVTLTLGTDFENDDVFTVRVVPEDTKDILNADGIRCRLQSDGTAAVISAECDTSGGIHIPEQITDPQTGAVFAVSGIAAELRAVIAETHTIYGVSGGNLEAYCAAHGLCFAADKLTDPVRGDLTGDGLVSTADLQTLNRILSECSGMVFDDAVMQAADLNADGLLDLIDVRLLSALCS